MKEYKVHSSWTRCCEVHNKAWPICMNKAGKIIGLTIRSGGTLVKLNHKGEELRES